MSIDEVGDRDDIIPCKQCGKVHPRYMAVRFRLLWRTREHEITYRCYDCDVETIHIIPFRSEEELDADTGE